MLAPKNVNVFLEGFDLSEGEKFLTVRHKCQVKEKLNALKERYPGEKFKNKLQRRFMSFFITHRSIKWMKKHYKSNYEFYFEQKRQLSGPFIIHPECIFRTSWNLIMLIVSFTILFLYPLFWAMAYVRKGQYQFFHGFQIYAEVFTWMDIFFNFFTTYYDDNDELCVDRVKIMTNYVHHRFIIDFLVALPTTVFEWLVVVDESEEDKMKNSYYVYINLFFVLKILRYVPFSHYFFSIFAYISKRQTVLLLLKAQIGFIIFLHWNSCIVTVTSALDAGIVFTDGKNKENWLLYNETYNSQYVLLHGYSVLRAMSYMFNIDYVSNWNTTHHRQYASGNIEMIFSSITAIFSQILFFTYVCLCSRAHKGMHESQHKFRRLIESLKSYIDVMNFNPQMAHKIMSSFRMRFGETYFKDQRFNEDFAALRCYKMLESIDLFNEFSKQALMKLASYLISETYFPGDIIEITSEVAMNFLSNGTVAVYSEDGVEFIHIEDGSYFGYDNVFTEIDPSLIEMKTLYLCVELCTIYQLPKKVFVNIIKDYPHILVKLEKELADKRHEYYRSHLLFFNTKKERMEKKFMSVG